MVKGGEEKRRQNSEMGGTPNIPWVPPPPPRAKKVASAKLQELFIAVSVFWIKPSVHWVVIGQDTEIVWHH